MFGSPQEVRTLAEYTARLARAWDECPSADQERLMSVANIG